MKKDLSIFIFFSLLTVLLRLSSFFQPVIDWDESLYLLVSRDWINGQIPYTGIWDNKPIGIYLLYCLAISFFGPSILSIRIISCIAVILTCYFLYKLGKILVQNKNSSYFGIIAGVLYAIFSLSNGGLAANTEIFFTPCVVFSFYLLLSTKNYPEQLFSSSSARLFAIGTIMGVGLQIKYVVLYDFIALVIILVGLLKFKYSYNKSHLTKIVSCFWLIVGFALPSILILLFYIATNHWQEYVYANFTANLINSTNSVFSFPRFLSVLRDRIAGDPLIWVCLLVSPLYWISFRKEEPIANKQSFIGLLIWFVMSFLAVCYTKRFHGHYFLQLLPSLCLISSYLISQVFVNRSRLDTIGKILAFILILVTPLSILRTTLPSLSSSVSYLYFYYINKGQHLADVTSQTSLYLKERIRRNDYIYVIDSEPIIYYLVDAKIPTKYAFPLFLISKHYSKIAGVAPLKELNLIMEKQPLYVIRDTRKAQQSGFYKELDRYLSERYFLERSIENINIYRLKIDSIVDLEDVQKSGK